MQVKGVVGEVQLSQADLKTGDVLYLQYKLEKDEFDNMKCTV